MLAALTERTTSNKKAGHQRGVRLVVHLVMQAKSPNFFFLGLGNCHGDGLTRDWNRVLAIVI
jgi:hypothetical protein